MYGASTGGSSGHPATAEAVVATLLVTAAPLPSGAVALGCADSSRASRVHSRTFDSTRPLPRTTAAPRAVFIAFIGSSPRRGKLSGPHDGPARPFVGVGDSSPRTETVGASSEERTARQRADPERVAARARS